MKEFKGTIGVYEIIRFELDDIEEEDLTENDLSEEENSYNIQLIKHSKEMLEMLQYLNRRGGLGLDIHNKIEQLIKQATELEITRNIHEENK